MAEEVGTSLYVISKWLKIHGLRTAFIANRFRCSQLPNPPGVVCPACGGKKARKALHCRPCSRPFRSGPNNPNWRGVGDVGILLRQWKAANWRPLVFARDSYTCRLCGDARGGNLNAHHVVHLSVLTRDARRAWSKPLDTPEQRLEFFHHLVSLPEISSIDNGITVCTDCHKKIHEREGVYKTWTRRTA